MGIQTNSLAAWEVELRVKEKELEILKRQKLLEGEERKRLRFRNLMIISILFTALTTAVGAYIWRSRKLISQQKEALEVNNQQLELSIVQQSFANERLSDSLKKRQKQIQDSKATLERVRQELDTKSFLASQNESEAKKLKKILISEENRLKLYQERFDADVKEKLGVPVQVTDGMKRLVVWTGSIPYLQIDDKHFEFLHDGKKVTIRSTIGKLLSELGPNRFCQVSRNTLVNLEMVRKIHKNGQIEFFGINQEVRLTKNFREEFLGKWDHLLNSRQKT